MKSFTRLLISSSFAALAGCATPGDITDRNDPDGYERITKKQDGNKTIYEMRNGCLVTETITREPNLYRFHSVMTCPWDKKVEP